MKVGPDNTEGSPFNYDFVSGKNTYVDTSYLISVADGTTLLTEDGAELVVEATDASGNTGNVNPIGDLFDCTGNYTDTESGITLTYASYVPETAPGG